MRRLRSDRGQAFSEYVMILGLMTAIGIALARPMMKVARKDLFKAAIQCAISDVCPGTTITIDPLKNAGGAGGGGGGGEAGGAQSGSGGGGGGPVAPEDAAALGRDAFTDGSSIPTDGTPSVSPIAHDIAHVFQQGTSRVRPLVLEGGWLYEGNGTYVRTETPAADGGSDDK